MMNLWRPPTLRIRLAVWYGLSGTLLLTLFSAALYTFVERRMAQPLDEQLRRDLAVVRKNLSVDARGEVTWEGRQVPSNAAWRWTDPWIEVWDGRGNLVRRFWPLDDRRLRRLPFAPAPGRDTVSIFQVAPGLRLRSLSVPYSAPGAPAGWMLRIMRVHQPAGDALGAMALIIVASLPVVVALLVTGGYILTRHWLKPLDKMVAQAERISADDLSLRLPVENPSDELGRLATVFNVTLDRLESSFLALDRFVADASHELRTPLTTLRSVGEVGLRGARSSKEYQDIIGSMLEEARRLQLLVQRLLELARAEGQAIEPNRERIRLDGYITDCVAELNILAENRGQQIAVQAEPCSAVTDPLILRQAFGNLLDNAVKYSPAGATILVSVSEESDCCRVSVSDQGPGIGPEDRRRLTERFFRTDSSRGRDGGGSGLGLAITKAYMHILGGSLGYEPLVPVGSRFWLTIPKA